MGAIHLTKISGRNFRDNLLANGSRLRTTVSFHSPLQTNFALIFKMADVGSLLLVLGIGGGFRGNK